MRLINADDVGSGMAIEWQKALVKAEIDDAPTIDPETLPIVRQLRAELARVTAERDAAVQDLCVDTKCFICAHLPDDGNMAHCEHYARCGLNYWLWKWRGPQKEATP